MNIEELKSYLLAIKEPEEYEGIVYDDCGGNVDDAYGMGVDHGYEGGRFGLAKEIIKLLEAK